MHGHPCDHLVRALFLRWLSPCTLSSGERLCSSTPRGKCQHSLLLVEKFAPVMSGSAGSLLPAASSSLDITISVHLTWELCWALHWLWKRWAKLPEHETQCGAYRLSTYIRPHLMCTPWSSSGSVLGSLMTPCLAVERMAVRAWGSLRSSVQVPDMCCQRGGSTLKCWLWPALSESHVAWQHRKQKPGAAETE